jgi:membrane protein insertase Oxa1/YidC/SpoIIIJ
VPDICVVDPKAPAGKSEIGSTPFLDGLNSFLDRIQSALDGNLGWLFKGLSAVFGVVLTPVHWFVDLWSFIAAGLAYGIEAVFVMAEWISEVTDGSLSPLIVSSLMLIIAIRLLALPLALHANTNAVRMSALSPHISAIQRKYANDRSRQAAEVQKLQRKTNANPLSCCWSVVFNVIAFASAWKLVQGLTVRSADGTFQSAFVHEGTHLSAYLGSTHELTTLAMDLTVTVTQVGWCAKLLPYLVTISAIVVLVVASTRPLWQSRRAVAVLVISFTLATTIFLPTFLLILKVGDSAFTLWQGRYLTARRQRLALRLREDPDFLRSVGELGTDLLPGTGDPDLPPPPHR